jgi:hypothetical protein
VLRSGREVSSLLFGIRPEIRQDLETGGVEVKPLASDHLGFETIVSARIGTQYLNLA